MTKKTRAKVRRALLSLSMVLVVAFAAIGGTIAWLQDETQVVTNTFSPSTIEVELEETDSADEDTDANNNDYQIIPGKDIVKDPKVSASSDVDYYVFVKVTKQNWPTWTETGSTKLKVDYEIAEGWTELEGDFGANAKVYYQAVNAGATLTDVSVLKDNKVNVSDTVTKEELATITTNKPTVTVQAYAIQQSGVDGAKFTELAAWQAISGAANE